MKQDRIISHKIFTGSFPILYQWAKIDKGNLPFNGYRYMNKTRPYNYWFHILPRHYPMAFARAVADQLEPMKRSAKGCPQLPEVLPPALFTITQMEWCEGGCWGLAKLPEFYSYLRKCKSLRIPSEWKPYFPRELPEAMIGGVPWGPRIVGTMIAAKPT